MRLCQLKDESGQPRVGVQTKSGAILMLSALDECAPRTMKVLIEEHAAGRFNLQALASRMASLSVADEQRLGACLRDLEDLAAPVTDPPKFFAIAINGRANWERSIKPENPTPQYFIKLRTCITGPADPVEIPDIGSVGPEVELALVIGKGGKHISQDNAYDHVLGYVLHNDLTAHDLRKEASWIRFRRKDGSEEQLTYPGRWKNFDTFSPMGPWLVTRDEIADPHNLQLTSTLNGEVLQKGSTDDCVFRIPELISFLSQAHTLEPGDIVSIGTVPAVEGWTMAGMHLRKFGGVIECEGEGLGRLANPIRAV